MPRPQRKALPIDQRKLAYVLRRQSGITHVRQLTDAGVTDSDIQQMLRRRLLVRVRPGVYADQTGELSIVQRAWVATLVPRRGAIADASALELAERANGDRLRLPIHLAVPSHCTVGADPDYVVVHHVARLEGKVHWSASPPRMRAEFAALRVASQATTEADRIAVLADAVNKRLTTTKALRSALAELPALPHRALLRDLLEDLSSGACSVLEHAYLTRVERAHGLPSAGRQVRRTNGGRTQFRDAEYTEFGVAVELDGRAFHEGISAWDRDHERDLDDLVAGREAIRLGYGQVMDRACATAGKVAAVLRRRGWTGVLTKCSSECPG